PSGGGVKEPDQFPLRVGRFCLAELKQPSAGPPTGPCLSSTCSRAHIVQRIIAARGTSSDSNSDGTTGGR
ncbi:hypothetical protein ACJ72_08425, partial [Emergomyces africanus]